MTPGAYLRMCREEATMTLQDLALCLDSEPAITCQARVEWLNWIEEGITPLGSVTAAALLAVPKLGLDPATLAVKMDRAAGIDLSIQLRPAFAESAI